ncbi:hypothetical protein Q4Y15_001771 [Campylobacter fetus]|uniref:Uncharacterized protein n=2 Tax=Campylobacter fetus TaxID=196 RepID=A0RNR1_CAMFF|nr:MULTISPECIES: hypothetical protein [Campylobacter]ABK83409.1 hypothetical protein CFF8240_0669 [Campylobacter fetus subsp. fetus 82-40]AIR80360.1 hypothetical protein CFV97608_0725 [Campylobacter fetus subsp. venerealis 97/608]AIR80958.1 hypothetical protein CFV97608_1341 [Campylobacter fetus subsp. venerealis 97/608]EAI3887420.1 hypothetical protein [Campylobacter fetus]EAI3916660.1 hypothetical protein [Campylobacter fetus]
MIKKLTDKRLSEITKIPYGTIASWKRSDGYTKDIYLFFKNLDPEFLIENFGAKTPIIPLRDKEVVGAIGISQGTLYGWKNGKGHRKKLYDFIAQFSAKEILDICAKEKDSINDKTLSKITKIPYQTLQGWKKYEDRQVLYKLLKSFTQEELSSFFS